ncbi:MAG: HEAT repeat domain-containing protein, partial [Planctomycetota bacterium]
DRGKVWNIATGELLVDLEDASPLVAVSFSPDGRRIGGAVPGAGRIWDATTGEVVARLGGHFGYVNGIAWSPDGTRLAGRGVGGRVGIWDALSGELLGTLQGHDDTVVDVAFDPTGNRVATASRDGTARTWNVEHATPPRTLVSAPDGPAAAILFSPDGSRLATIDEDHAVSLVDPKTGRLLRRLVGHEEPIQAAAWSPDGRHLATGGGDFMREDDTRVRVWNVETGTLEKILEAHPKEVTSIAYAPDGTLLLTVDDEGLGVLWETQTWEPRIRLSLGHDEKVAFFSPDGSRVVIGGSFEPTLYDTESGQAVIRLKQDAVIYATLDREGERLLTADHDDVGRLWDLSTGRLVAVFDAKRSDSFNMYRAEFNPDESRVLTTSGDGYVRVWSVDTCEILVQVRCTTETTSFIARYSADGAFFVTAGTVDGAARVWDAETGKLLKVCPGAYGIDLSSDGRRLAGTARTLPGGPMRIWDLERETLDPAEVRALLEERVSWRLQDGRLVRRSAVPDAEPLLADLESDDWRTRERALVALARIDDHPPEVYARIGALLDDPTHGVGRAAYEWLVARSTDALPVLVDLMSHGNSDVRAAAAQILREMGWSAQDAVPALIQALGDEVDSVRFYASDALAKIGPPAVPALIRAAEHGDARTRPRAIEALAGGGVATREALPLLLRALRGEDSALREAAVSALAGVRPTSQTIVSALVEVVGQECARRARRSDFLHRALMQTFQRLGREAVPFLVPCLKHEDAGARAIAAEVLGELGAQAEEALPALKAACADPDETVKRAAERALQSIEFHIR